MMQKLFLLETCTCLYIETLMYILIKLWQERFTQNLIDNGDSNPSADSTMAFKVLKPYFVNDLAELDYSKLQDGSIINNILNKFRSCEETNLVTKIKYNGFLERLIKFLAQSCKSVYSKIALS